MDRYGGEGGTSETGGKTAKEIKQGNVTADRKNNFKF
jgi:hypothetical protein